MLIESTWWWDDWSGIPASWQHGKCTSVMWIFRNEKKKGKEKRHICCYYYPSTTWAWTRLPMSPRARRFFPSAAALAFCLPAGTAPPSVGITSRKGIKVTTLNPYIRARENDHKAEELTQERSSKNRSKFQIKGETYSLRSRKQCLKLKASSSLIKGKKMRRINRPEISKKIPLWSSELPKVCHQAHTRRNSPSNRGKKSASERNIDKDWSWSNKTDLSRTETEERSEESRQKDAAQIEKRNPHQREDSFKDWSWSNRCFFYKIIMIIIRP